jgi:hypothetical protein
MTLPTKIQLMKDLIIENPDITIGEYAVVVKEIESIEHKTEDLYLQTSGGIVDTAILR